MSIRTVVPPEEAEWRAESPPAWVEPREPDWEFAPAGEYPLALLLVDEQHDVATQAVFSRTVRHLLTHAAVQALGQATLEFDPAAHRLLVHELAVWRQGVDGWQRHAVARPEGFLLRQREQQLEQQMLNGRLSLVALLEDVRVGDAIDLAWTLEPREPLPGLRFTIMHAFGWNAPVARASISVRQDPAKPATCRIHAGPDDCQPTERAFPGGVAWEIERPPILFPEPNAPSSIWPCAILDGSAWSSWSEVADFVAGLWADALVEGADAISECAAKLREAHSGEALLREAIRFVQEDLRYLAVDFGHGAGMLPNGAGTVLRRRFGDCKDKSVLLAALLRALGYDACPLLVAAGWQDAIRDTQPSTAVFSHSIVGFTVDGNRYWVDPTLIGQGGDLARRTPPPYGCGLEVRAGADALTTLPEAPIGEFEVVETFDLDRDGKGGTAEQVISVRGPMADDLRAALVQGGVVAFGKARAEGLKACFPGLVPSEQLPEIEDDLDANTIRFRALHQLPTWGEPGSKTPAKFRYAAQALSYAVEPVVGPEQRRMPWQLRHPMHARHRIVVRGNCVQSVAGEKRSVEGTGFRYDRTVTGKRGEAVFDFRWETTQSEVPPGDFADYCRDRARAFSQAGAVVPTGRSMLVYQIVAGFFLGSLLSNAWDARDGCGDGGIQAPITPTRIESTRRGATRIDSARIGAPASTLSAARRATERGDYASAATLLDQVAPVYEDSHAFHALRAEVAIRAGQSGPARAAIDAAQRIDASDAAVALQKARLARLEGDLPAARKMTERVLRFEPEDPGALFLAAVLAHQEGDVPGALRAWERALAAHPDDPDVLLRHATLLWRSGEQARANGAVALAERARPTPALDSALASYFTATSQPDRALASATRAAERAPDDPQYAKRHAMAMLRAGDPPGALAEARRLNDRFPGEPAAASALAVVAAAVGERDTAERAFEAWLAGDPEDPEAVASYANFLHQTGRTERASSVLERATHEFPNSGVVWLNHATVLAALGDGATAERARERAQALLYPAEAPLVR